MPRHAATVLLLRESAAGVEVLLTRRHENLAFMGGLWVFPGGTLSPADLSSDSMARIPDRAREGCARLHDIAVNPCRRTTVWDCASPPAARRSKKRVCCSPPRNRNCIGKMIVSRMSRIERRAIVSHPELFATPAAGSRACSCRLDRLVYWAHWITPSNAPRRFDTRFFVAAVPPGQTARIDTMETSDHAWMRPADVIEAAVQARMPVSQPTLFNLMELQTSLDTHGSLPALLAAEARTRHRARAAEDAARGAHRDDAALGPGLRSPRPARAPRRGSPIRTIARPARSHGFPR